MISPKFTTFHMVYVTFYQLFERFELKSRAMLAIKKAGSLGFGRFFWADLGALFASRDCALLLALAPSSTSTF